MRLRRITLQNSGMTKKRPTVKSWTLFGYRVVDEFFAAMMMLKKDS